MDLATKSGHGRKGSRYRYHSWNLRASIRKRQYLGVVRYSRTALSIPLHAGHGPPFGAASATGQALRAYFYAPGSLIPRSMGDWRRDTVREVDIVTGCFFLLRKRTGRLSVALMKTISCTARKRTCACVPRNVA